MKRHWIAFWEAEIIETQRKKLVIWAPYRGRVGTIKAAENYALICRDLGFDVVFVELCDEWSSHPPVAEQFSVVSLSKMAALKNIGKSNFFRRRDFFAYSFLKIGSLRRVLKALKPDVIVSMLCTVPLVIAAKNSGARLIGSLQGFPKFLDKKTAGNHYFRLEDWLRGRFWKRYYGRLDEVVCMTPETASQISDFLTRDSHFCPNPLFEFERNKTMPDIDENAAIDLVAIGRFSRQKRFDLAVAFFRAAKKVFPTTRLHFFGDVSARQMQAGHNMKRDEANIVFHGFSENLWSGALSNLNAIHVVASDWEDPGHAILEGIEAGVPTIFLNPDAAYVGLYQTAQPVIIGEAAWSDAKGLKTAIAKARDGAQREKLRTQIASQFSYAEVSKQMGALLNV